MCADRNGHRAAANLDGALEMLQKLIDPHGEVTLMRERFIIVKPGTLIQYGHVGQANAAIVGGAHQRLQHRVVLVGLRRITMQVVKFCDRGVTTRHHLAVGLSRDRGEPGGINPTGELVHTFPPGPEIVTTRWRALLGVSGQRALKGVAVRVTQARYDKARQLVPSGGRHARFCGANTPAVQGQTDIVAPALR